MKIQTQVSRKPLNKIKQVRGAKSTPDHEEDVYSILSPTTPFVFRQNAKKRAREASRSIQQLQILQSFVTPEPLVSQRPTLFPTHQLKPPEASELLQTPQNPALTSYNRRDPRHTTPLPFREAAVKAVATILSSRSLGEYEATGKSLRCRDHRPKGGPSVQAYAPAWSGEPRRLKSTKTTAI